MQFERLGPYKIGPRLGRGGMGAVYEGVNSETGEAAAVKVLNPHLADDEGFCQRFDLEIETLKKLKHPNIVRMLGYGQQDGHLFYAMELVRGHSVEEELQQGRRFNWREVVQDSVKLCKALRHAHDHGVIHRDLKPANLLLTEDESDIKLTDFGIARLFGNTRLTMDGALVGTAEYMSPEQASGERVTPQSDLYSLGGVMFAMLAGRPPFRAFSLGEMLHKQRFDPPPRLAQFANDVPAELQELIGQLLSKDPAVRPPNALVLGRQLAAMEHGLSIVLEKPSEVDVSANDQELAAVEEPVDECGATRAATPPLPVATHNADDATMVAPAPMSPADVSAKTAASGMKTSIAGPAKVAAVAASPIAASLASAPRATTVVENRFTTVEEDERDRARLAGESNRTPIGQIVLLAMSIVIILGLAWYFTRPPSAEKLWARIDAAAADGDPNSLSIEDDMRSFLARFPDDEHAAAVKQYQDEFNLQRLEKRFQLRVSRGDSLSLVERDYLEAMNESGVNPQRTIDKLQALVQLYGSQGGQDESQEQCVELARREIVRLKQQSAKTALEYQKLIDENLKRAEGLRQTSPQEAREIWQSIITLYGNKPWGAESVARAKAALATVPSVETADQRK